MRCAIYGCNFNNKKKGHDCEVSLHAFPKDNALCKKWVFLCRRSDKFNVKTSRICSKHFNVENFAVNPLFEQYNIKLKRYLKKDAFRSVFLPTKMAVELATPRNVRMQARALQSNATVTKDQNINVSSDTSTMEQIIEAASPQNMCVSSLMELDVEFTDEVRGTNPENVECAQGTEQASQTVEIIPSRSQIVKLKQICYKQSKIIDSLDNIFTKTQLKKLENPKQRAKWTIDDIAKAIPIYAAGPRAYRLLLKNKYPFPAVITLKKYCAKIKVYPGILQCVLNIMNKVNMKPLDKICIVSFDEMKIREKIVYDKAKDETLKAAKYVQVAMVRGLFGNWKQPIYYDYDTRMTEEILFKIICAIHSCGFVVCAIVCDLGGTNQGLLRDLNINVKNSFFPNPANQSKNIYVFADVPHLTKLIRNNFVDNNGFIIDGEVIHKGIIEELISKTNKKSDLSVAFKISSANLNVRGAERQKVKLATKLFSHTISSAIFRAGSLGELNSKNWIKCAEFFKQVNDWFDCLNVRAPYKDSRPRVQGVGLAESVQFEIVEKMSETMFNMRVNGKTNMMPFQKGVIMTNNSLKLLYDDLKSQYNISYLLTYRLNQDVLENFFGVMRAKGGLYDHPERLEFMYRLRSYILGRNEGSLSSNGNTLVDDTPDLDSVGNLSGDLFRTLTSEINTEAPTDELESLQYDGLEHLAGYICHRINNPDLVVDNLIINTQQDTSFTWTNQITEGFLQKPSENLMCEMENLNLFLIRLTRAISYIAEITSES